ncbi:MAG: monovalent cation:proton antiporter-2 (CPA2) family protein [Pseudomonadota bacterium]
MELNMAGGEASGILNEAVILLGGAVVAAPLFKRIGLGTVLGYLSAGVVIGPMLGLITDAEAILQVSELGVVFLLFVIGLELNPKRLWALRRDIFGLGFLQVMITGAVLMALTLFIGGFSFAASAVIGFGLALSSTAFALQILDERGERGRPHGQKSFAILLFQDIAIVPLLAVIPLLASSAQSDLGSGWTDFGIALAAIGLLIAIGRYGLNPLFRIIGNTGAKEAMIATALFIVLGSAVLMQTAGVSMALGAFIAGVMLAESSFRHELEANIEPFRGLLLGLFFMAIGLSLNLAVLLENWPIILIAAPLLMLIKAILIYLLCRAFGNGHQLSIRTSLFLPQAGEFGFVMFSAATSLAIFEASIASLLIAIVTASMALTPLSVMLFQLLIGDDKPEELDEDFADVKEGADVLMIGFSRLGQIAAQMLLAGGNSVTVIDNSAERVRSAQKFGFRIYFGDGTRKEVLEAAGIRNAKIVAIVTQRKFITTRVVDLIQREFPESRLFVRAYDRAHTLELRAKGVDFEVRETFESGLKFGQQTLEALGASEALAKTIRNDVRKRDEQRLAIQAADGIFAGTHMLLNKPVSPEPLMEPEREAEILNPDRDGIEEKLNQEPATS